MQQESHQNSIQRLRIEIQGAVQGVGFRPFVYRLANSLHLTGWIINTPQGVILEVEGQHQALTHFLERLPDEKPPLAAISALTCTWLLAFGYTTFEIRHSQTQGEKTALVLPDIATCPDCLAEIADPNNHRYRYPFTNCTNCGPRFSIIRALPYDRAHTTMHHFTMCPTCQAEYDNPMDRRFHAQPNACPVCGPQLSIVEGREQQREDSRQRRDAIREAATALRNGQIVALKGLGGFHLLVDARNAEAVARLRERKSRRDKPFALMVRDMQQANTICTISPQEQTLLTTAAAPIVLLRRREGESEIADNVAAGINTLGIMLPYTPLHFLLLHEVDFPLVATSGNVSDEPICTDEQEAFQRLGHIADLFLVHNRPIERHVDDSVAWVVDGTAQLLRRARGYAPLPVPIPHPIPTILAVGAHLKNSVALGIHQQVFISQHIGDLETAEALNAFERVIADFIRLYEASPVVIAHDLHPDYLSTRRATEVAAEPAHPFAALPMLIAVQHHHAHLAACLADNGVTERALGVIWDGTGYGTDGSIWGGEFLLGNAADYTRVAHLRPFCLPGGDAAVREPRRTALALLWELYGEATFERDDLAIVRTLQSTERTILSQMLQRRVNTPTTTSAGRLFDAVAALIGLHPRVSFEGQAAIALEAIADTTIRAAYPLNLLTATSSCQTTGTSAPLVLDWQPLLESVLADLRRGEKRSIIAAKFHNSLVNAIRDIAQFIGQPHVALTGGCFQNRLLTEWTAQHLREAGFTPLCHRQVPPNDGGISLGQVMVAAAHYHERVGCDKPTL